MKGARAAAALVVAVMVGAAAMVGWGFARREGRTRAAWREAWTVAAAQSVHRATARTVVLPERLRALTVDGTVALWRTRDGRAYLIGKTSVGYKGNWRGVVYGPSPLAASELTRDGGGRPGIVFDEGHYLFESSLVRSRGGGLYDVAFDLN